MYIFHLLNLIVALMQNISVFFNTISICFTQQEETSFIWTNSSEAEGIVEGKKGNQSLIIEQSRYRYFTHMRMK